MKNLSGALVLLIGGIVAFGVLGLVQWWIFNASGYYFPWLIIFNIAAPLVMGFRLLRVLASEGTGYGSFSNLKDDYGSSYGSGSSYDSSSYSGSSYSGSRYGGASREQQIFLGVAAVLKSGAQTAGENSPEWDRAVAHLITLADGALTETQASSLLRRANLNDVDATFFDERERLLLLGMALEVAAADGRVSTSERSRLRGLAAQLFLDLTVVDLLIERMGATSGGYSAGGARPSAASRRAQACETLDVSPDAQLSEIRAAYRRLATKHHPDLVPEHERASANETMAQINAAYDYLVGATQTT